MRLHAARTVRSALSILPFLAACAGGGMDTGAARPATLAYAMPDEGMLTFAQSDTAQLVMDMGGQVLSMDIRNDGVMDMEFSPAGGGMQVSTTWRELEASQRSQMTPPVTLSVDDLDEPLVFTLAPTGGGELVSAPDLPAGTEQLLSMEGMARAFFPGLPGTPPEVGMTWSDTVLVERTGAGMNVSNRSVLDYTVRGDTTVAGRTLLKVDMNGRQEVSASGTQQGMNMEQDLSGGLSGFFLWDLADGMMHYQYTETDLAGVIDVDAAPIPFDVSLNGVSHVRRVAN